MARPKKSHADTVMPSEDIEPDADDARTEDAMQFAVDTLTGDVRNRLLAILRNEQSKLPWDKRSEADQEDTVHRMDAWAREMVEQAVSTIAGHGRVVIQAHIEKAEVKEGIKAVITLGRSDSNRHQLLDAVGSRVMIVIADAEVFTGEREPVEITPDQASMLGDVLVEHSADHGVDGSAPFH